MSDDKTNALTIYQKIGDPIAACEKLGAWFLDSGLFGIQKKGQGTMLALTCMIKGLDPIEVAQKFHIIEGHLAKKAATVQAEFQARGGRITWIERTAEAAEALFLHPDYAPKGVRIRVTLKELMASGVAQGRNGVKDNYKRFPRRMLHARCISEGVTAVDPEVMVGFSTPEELADMLDKPLGTVIDAEAVPVEAPAPQGGTKEPEAVVQEGSEPAASPEPAEDPERVAQREHVERVERVLSAFKPYTITQEDLERLAGDFETGEVVEADSWTDEHFDKIKAAYDKVRAAKPSERKETICAVFNLPSSEMEG